MMYSLVEVTPGECFETLQHVHKPEIRDYWSTDRPILGTPVVGNILWRIKSLRIDSEVLALFYELCPISQDRLGKLQTITDLLLKNFQSLYRLGQAISIDEAMVLWRGRLQFRQYIPGKRHKYGVKIYLLCSPNGYVYNAKIYCGKSTLNARSPYGHGETVVLTLADSLLDKGRTVYVDNFYTSLPLAKELLKRKTLLCGTLRSNRKYLPRDVVGTRLQRGEVVRRWCYMYIHFSCRFHVLYSLAQPVK